MEESRASAIVDEDGEKGDSMSGLLIRNFNPQLMTRLLQRAIRHHRSPEAEAYAILAHALLTPEAEPHFADVMTQLFGTEHGVDLSIPSRADAC